MVAVTAPRLWPTILTTVMGCPALPQNLWANSASWNAVLRHAGSSRIHQQASCGEAGLLAFRSEAARIWGCCAWG